MEKYPGLERAIAETKNLFRRRNSPEDWARNLIEGSRGIKTSKGWGLYYAFLANPKGFDITKEVIPFNTSEYNPEPYPEYMTVEKFQNGPSETIIHVKNTKYMNMEDEKTPL